MRDKKGGSDQEHGTERYVFLFSFFIAPNQFAPFIFSLSEIQSNILPDRVGVRGRRVGKRETTAVSVEISVVCGTQRKEEGAQ